MTPVRSLLVVAGPGRSGTSLATGLVGRLGYHVPQPEITVDARNPRGYGEPRWVVEYHKRLMKVVGLDMGDTRPDAVEHTARIADDPAVRAELRRWLSAQFDTGARVVVKDPRLFWFLSLYAAVASELGVHMVALSMVRDPAEAVRSATTAYPGVPATTRLSGWLTGTLAVERLTRDVPHVLIRHDDLVTDWRAALAPLDGVLPAPLLAPATPAALAAADELVDPALRRSSAGWTDLDVPDVLRDLAQQVYATVRPRAGAPDVAHRREIDELDATHREMYAAAEDLVRSSISAARKRERRRVEREAAERGVTRRAAAGLRPLARRWPWTRRVARTVRERRIRPV